MLNPSSTYFISESYIRLYLVITAFKFLQVQRITYHLAIIETLEKHSELIIISFDWHMMNCTLSIGYKNDASKIPQEIQFIACNFNHFTSKSEDILHKFFWNVHYYLDHESRCRKTDLLSKHYLLTTHSAHGDWPYFCIQLSWIFGTATKWF